MGIIEVLVTPKTIKLAKKCGFDVSNIEYRDSSTHRVVENAKARLSYFDGMEDANLIQRPTQALLQKWLREELGIIINVVSGLQHNNYMFSSYLVSLKGYLFKSKFKDTYEQALEKGLQEALKFAVGHHKKDRPRNK